MSTRRKSAHASMLHLWDFMSTPEFIAFAHAQYGWLRCPATATLYSALSGDVYGELLPPHGERYRPLHDFAHSAGNTDGSEYES